MDYTVKERVRWLLRQRKMRASKDLFETLNYKVEEILEEAFSRAKHNNRTTVMPYDV